MRQAEEKETMERNVLREHGKKNGFPIYCRAALAVLENSDEKKNSEK